MKSGASEGKMGTKTRKIVTRQVLYTKWVNNKEDLLGLAGGAGGLGVSMEEDGGEFWVLGIEKKKILEGRGGEES